jgi:hypothetical protein
MRPKTIRGILLALTLLAASSGVTLAGSSFEFLFDASYASDDQEVFLHLAVKHYSGDRRSVEDALHHLRHVKADLPVALFLAAETGRPLRYIIKLRASGHSWATIFARAEVSLSVLFRGIDRDPGPPYGKAWGHWKKQSGSADLSDADVRAWVEIQMGQRLTGRPAFELARSAGQGTPVFATVAKGKRKSAGKSATKSGSTAGSDAPGKGKSKGKKGQ